MFLHHAKQTKKRWYHMQWEDKWIMVSAIHGEQLWAPVIRGPVSQDQRHQEPHQMWFMGNT